MNIKISGKTVFVIVAGAGMVITAWLAAKNAPNAQKKKEEALQAKREATGDENAQLTIVESFNAQIGSYVPAIISGVVTLGSFVGSEVINADNYRKGEKMIEEYKNMTDRIGGAGTSKFIEKAVEQKKLEEKADKDDQAWEKRRKFKLKFEGETLEFESTLADVTTACYFANRQFILYGILTFNEFLNLLDQQMLTDKASKEGDRRGWEACVGEAVYGYSWIDIDIVDSDEPDVKEITFPVYPHLFDEEEAYKEVEREYRYIQQITDGSDSDHPRE